MKRVRKQKGSLPQKMTAILLSAVLTAGLISNAVPVNVLAQGNIGPGGEEIQQPTEGDSTSGNTVSGNDADVLQEEANDAQTQLAEVSYSTDGGQTWVDVEDFYDVFFESDYLDNDNTIICLNKDITMGFGSIVPVTGGKHTTIDGQGHTIYRGSCNAQLFTLSMSGHVTFQNITIDGGAVWNNAEDVKARQNSGYSSSGTTNLIYIDNGNASVTLGAGAILQNNSLVQSSYNGAAVLINDGKLIMNSGSVIRNNSAAGTGGFGGGGGAVGINRGGIFTMNGGEIYGNYASVTGGAVVNKGIFQLHSGEIYKNASDNNGGGVANDSGNMSMDGGEITGNISSVGGGISVLGSSSLSVSAGNIHHNTASRFAGGVYAGGRIDLSYFPRITDNTAKGNADNLYLPEGKTITVSGALTGNASIGVTTAATPSAEAPVKITDDNVADYSEWFNSDNADYKIENGTDNVVWLVVKGSGDDNDKGEINTIVDKGSNVPPVDISSSVKELEDMLLTDNEKQQVERGTNIKIVLGVQDAGDTVSAADKSAVEAELNDYSMGQYLDISLYKLVGTNRTDITETTEKIAIAITVPDSLKNTDSNKTRTFAVLRVHDGRPELLNDLDNSPDTITIETNRFSTYAVVYKDTAVEGGNGDTDNGNADDGHGSNDNNNSNNNDNSSNNDNEGGTADGGSNNNNSNNSGNNSNNNSGGNNSNNSGNNNGNKPDNNGSKADRPKDKEPGTGDVTPIELYATLSMIAGFTYLLLYFGDHRRGMSETEKEEIVARLVSWAKKGGKIRKLFIIAVIFVLLVYYHSIGKKMCMEWKEVCGE